MALKEAIAVAVDGFAIKMDISVLSASQYQEMVDALAALFPGYASVTDLEGYGHILEKKFLPSLKSNVFTSVVSSHVCRLAAKGCLTLLSYRTKIVSLLDEGCQELLPYLSRRSCTFPVLTAVTFQGQATGPDATQAAASQGHSLGPDEVPELADCFDPMVSLR